MFDIFMTFFTEEQRFSLEGYHPHDPGRFWPSWVFMEIAHLSYVMHLYVLMAPAKFARICEKSLYEF